MSDALTPLLADGLGVKPQRIAVVVTLLFLVLVIELVRRRRLVERYALLWITAALVLVVLAVWNGALNWIADQLGILSPPNALFLIGVGALMVLVADNNFNPAQRTLFIALAIPRAALE